jgi:hypothetical protein
MLLLLLFGGPGPELVQLVGVDKELQKLIDLGEFGLQCMGKTSQKVGRMNKK